MAIAGVAVVGAGLLGSVLPASAQQETVTLTLLNGAHITLTLDVPPGTPVDALPLPKLLSPIVGITVDSVSSPTPTPGVPGTPPVTLGRGAATTPGGAGSPGAASTLAGAAPGSDPSPTLPATSDTPPRVGSQHAQRITSSKRGGLRVNATTGRGASGTNAAAGPQATAVRAANGLPTAANPALTVAQLGPISVGVPNFFIDKFRLPPFLIPIYQAAGVEYDVPWQVLAAINEIETDYGRNLSVSSAGAEGWMQFLPETWKVYGVDANGDGVKDPYNPVDAIFAAARYLNAAGAAKDLKSAIFAYNHASWYVDSVMLRAQLIGGLPDDLVSSISGLTQGRFPVLAQSRYADDPAEAKAAANSAGPRNVSSTAVNIYARSGAAVAAAQDGVIAALGTSPTLGKYVVLRDTSGNTYTYSQLKTIAALFPEPKPHAQLASAVDKKPALPGIDPAPLLPASDGFQAQTQQLAHAAAVPPPAPSSASPVQSGPSTPAAATAASGSLAPQRLFAHPLRAAAYAAGGRAQLAGVLGLRASDVTERPLRKGAHVTAGTILGRIGKTSPALAPHLTFQVRPAGKSAPLIDPKPILDGWKLLESTAIYRAANKSQLLASEAPTIGQVLLESKDQLQQRVLSDPNVDIYPCGRRDIESGQIDRRVLATLEFLSGSGLKPSVSGLKCGHHAVPGFADDAAGGNGVDISAVNGIPILGHQGAGSIADIAVRRLLTLQGTFKPLQIVSLMQYPGVANTVAMPDHADRVHVAFSPSYDPSSKLGRDIAAALKPKQWSALVARLTQIQSPVVSGKPSPQAIPDVAPAPHAG